MTKMGKNAQSGVFVVFFYYLCPVIDDFACLEMQH